MIILAWVANKSVSKQVGRKYKVSQATVKHPEGKAVSKKKPKGLI